MADVKTEKKFASLEIAKKINDDIGSLKEDLGDLLHHPKEYWTLGDITVPITGE